MVRHVYMSLSDLWGVINMGIDGVGRIWKKVRAVLDDWEIHFGRKFVPEVLNILWSRVLVLKFEGVLKTFQTFLESMFIVGTFNSSDLLQLGFFESLHAGSSGCIGCCTKVELISSHNKPVQGPKRHSLMASKASYLRTSEPPVHKALAVGRLLWNQIRQKWIGNKKSTKSSQKLHEPRLSWNANYDSLLSSNKPFTKPVPLAEMADFLVDIWEQEGLYD
ncbi:Salicylic acid-binding protein 2 [Olea europaea subsp. europaea]|uniref:Salicylic acid-binding protein 2 n=1 Tax=Olea europaea subsp. europaea TaxID=158383 RepID=A0A8S0PJ40_OLEEU|nr:Salicylic acid-binding protein 2 [Olea europaea subsp. europaea]